MTPEHKNLITRALKRTRRNGIIAVVVTFPTAIAMLVAAFAATSETTGIRVTAGAFGAVFFATGCFLVWWLSKLWNPERAPIMRVLEERPRDIVWVYVEEIRSSAAVITVKNHNVKIAVADGKMHTLSVANRDKDAVLELLGELAPDAVFGYDRARAKAFKRDPRAVAVG